MPRSFLNQALQVAGSVTYNDAIASSNTVGVAEAQANLEGDLNVLRTRMLAIHGATNWYDDPEMTVQAIADKYFIVRIHQSGFDSVSTGTGTTSLAFDTAIKTISGEASGAGSSSAGGVILNATKSHKVHIRTSSDQNPIDDGSGNEVYGRLSWTGTQYQISWFSVVAGTETAYNFTGAQTVDLAYVLVSRRYEDLDWDVFTDSSFHDVASVSGSIDDSNVNTGPFSFLLSGDVTQQDVNAKVDLLGSTANGEGISGIAVEDSSGYFTGTDGEAVLTEIHTQLGGATSTTYNFTEENVLADNDFIYPALNKLDLRWGDLGNTANGEGASLVGIEDSGGNFTATDVEGALAELASSIEDVTGWEKQLETLGAPITSGSNHTLPGSMTYTTGGNHLDVYYNGQLLTVGASNDYTEVSTTQISFTFTVPTNSNMTYMARQ